MQRRRLKRTSKEVRENPGERVVSEEEGKICQWAIIPNVKQIADGQSHPVAQKDQESSASCMSLEFE